jgi:SsrA-binding protein
LKSKVERKAAAAGIKKDKAREPDFDNRRARFEYEKLESLEVGIALTGTEIKSIRTGNVSINEAYARVRERELWLVNFSIPPYKEASFFNHEPSRPRKLLLHRAQLDRLMARAAEKGLTLVPLRMYFKAGKVKVELGLMKGKKIWDKRRTIADRDAKRDLARSGVN